MNRKKGHGSAQPKERSTEAATMMMFIFFCDHICFFCSYILWGRPPDSIIAARPTHNEQTH